MAQDETNQMQVEDQCSDKMENTAESIAKCPLRYIQDILGGKWKLPIICILSSGESFRNAVIKKRLGDITNTVLSQTLKELEASGLIHREQFNEVPPHVEYSLTEDGRAVLPIIGDLANWATEDMQKSCCRPNCEICTTTE